MCETKALDMDSPSVLCLCEKDKRLAKVIRMVGPIIYEPHSGSASFSFLVHEVVEQMLSIKAGGVIYGRIESLCEGVVSPKALAILSEEQIRAAGVSMTKARCISGLARAVIDGALDLESMSEMSDAEVIARLTALPGVGVWTAKMYLIFALDRPDVLPWEDGAFLQTYKWVYKTRDISRQAVERKCRKWRPYASIGVRFFYRALDMGFTKNEFHLYK